MSPRVLLAVIFFAVQYELLPATQYDGDVRHMRAASRKPTDIELELPT